jgi:LacI family transcriptional regulator
MRRPLERRVVLADVARSAGTSQATASRALKDDPRIGESTRSAVQAAARKLGYVPNAAARSLRARRTHILGLLLDDLADPVHGKVAAGFEEAAAGQGFAVFMMTALHDLEREQRALTAFIEHRADGIAMASCVSDPSDVHRRFPKGRVVFVQPDYPALAEGVEPPARGVLRTDDLGGVTASVRHLVDQGYRRLCFVGPVATSSGIMRLEAASAAARGLGLRPIRSIKTTVDAWRDATAVAHEIAADPPDAVLCYDDKLALSILDGLRSTPLEVPDDLAVVGFDGIPAARQSRPRLTTVDVPSVEVGCRAAEMLIAAAHGGTMPPSEVMPVSLVVRDSAPARTRDAARPRSGEPVATRSGGRR